MNNYKVALALTASMFVFNAFAESCIREVCVEDNIIDDYGILGKVLTVNPAGNEVIYLRKGYSSVTTASVSSVSDEIENEEFPKNKLVLDDYNIKGNVVMAFRNGTILYQRKGYGTTNTNKASNLSPEIEFKNGVMKNSRAIDDYNITGTVNNVFKDGRISFMRDGYSAENVTTAFSNGVLGYEDVKKEVIVIDDYNIIGTVVETFADGRLKYLRNGYGSPSITSYSKISPIASTVGGMEVGSLVIDDYNIEGIVKMLFKDGRVSYQRNGYGSPNISTTRQLSISVNELNGLMNGKRAIDDYNIEGTVQRIYKNGSVSFQRDGYGSINITTKASPEIDKISGYSKELTYASDSQIGKPTAFYANGMISLGGKISSKLYESVTEFNGLMEGSEAFSIDAKNFKINQIFANGIASVTIKDKVKTTKIYQAKNLDSAISLDNFISVASMKFMSSKDADYSDFLFSKEDAFTVKTKVIARLKEDKRSPVSDKETRIKMLKALGELESAPSSVTAPANMPSELPSGEKILVNIEPADMASEIKNYLVSKGFNPVQVNLQDLKTGNGYIFMRFEKSLMSGKCELELLNKGMQANVSKTGSKDVKKCISELKKLIY